jgi:cell division protein FtsB
MAAGALARVMRRWWPVLALALVLAALQSKLWFGAGGLPDARALQQSVREQREDNARLQQRNDALGAEVEDLKSGETAVEERARSELGMIKPGETFYRVVEPHPGTAAAPAAPASAPPPADATTGSTSAPPATAASVHAADEAASPAGAPAGEAPPGLPTTDADTPPAASNDAPEPTP